jgi:DNA-binding NtrC family response regulator
VSSPIVGSSLHEIARKRGRSCLDRVGLNVRLQAEKTAEEHQALGQVSQTVLVVDDEENTRLGMSKLLAHEGYAVISAASAEEALVYLGQSPVDVVISDVKMPGMGGLHFLRELGRRHPGTAVIMVTAFAEVESYIEAMSLGAFEYLHKPVRVDELRSAICKLTSRL